MLKGENLTKSYGKGHEAVRNAGISIKAGEIVGLVGESGSGKSTLARILMQLENPDMGSVFLNGQFVATMAKRDYYRKCQIVFQNATAALNPVWSIRNILMEPLRSGKEAKEEKEEKVLYMLKKFNLPVTALEKRPSELSGGERQRINLLRSLLIQPDLLICDEVVSNLDRLTQKGIVDLLVDLSRKNNLAILFISHDLQVTNYMCDRIYVMHKGEIVEESIKTEGGFAFSHVYAEKLFAAASIGRGMLTKTVHFDQHLSSMKTEHF